MGRLSKHSDNSEEFTPNCVKQRFIATYNIVISILFVHFFITGVAALLIEPNNKWWQANLPYFNSTEVCPLSNPPNFATYKVQPILTQCTYRQNVLFTLTKFQFIVCAPEFHKYMHLRWVAISTQISMSGLIWLMLKVKEKKIAINETDQMRGKLDCAYLFSMEPPTLFVHYSN